MVQKNVPLVRVVREPFLRELRNPRLHRFPYLDRMLMADEHVIYAAGLHWIIYHEGTWMLSFGFLLWFFGPDLLAALPGHEMADILAAPLKYLAWGIMAVGGLHLFFTFLRQTSTELVLTNQRLIAKHGLIAATVHEAAISKISSVNIEQTVGGRLLGYGTVGVDGSGFHFHHVDHVADPYRFYYCAMCLIREAVRAEKSEAQRPFPRETGARSLPG